MSLSLRAMLLGIVLVTSLLPLAVLGYTEAREDAQARTEGAGRELQATALALAIRAEAAARAGGEPLEPAARLAPGERIFLLAQDGTWRAPDGTTGRASALAVLVGDRLTGSGFAAAPDTAERSQVAWARVPDAQASLVVARAPLEASLFDMRAVSFAGFLAAGAIVVGVLLTTLVVRPLRGIEAASRRFASGRLDTRVTPRGTTELRSLARSFNAMADDISRLAEARTERLAQNSSDLQALNFAIAHEVREPLRSMRWIVADLRETPRTDRHALELLDDKMAHLDRLLADLERYERAAREDAPVVDLDLARVVEAAALEVPEARVEVQGRLPAARANPDLLRAAFAEVLRNASEHANARVQVSGESAGGQVQLYFDDDGPGIPAARREDALHLFQRFHRGGGTGVGLAIARRVAERHGGTLELADSPLGGLRVVLALRREGPADIVLPVPAAAGRRF